MTLYDQYRQAYPIAAEPSELREIIEAEVKRALEWMRGRDALSERHQRLVEAAKDLLNAITGLCGDEYSCFSTCSLANECDKDSGNECLWVARLRAALEGEGSDGK